MDFPEVRELIDYTQDLEGQVMDVELSKQYDLEDKLSEVLRDIYISIKQLDEQNYLFERFGNKEFPKPNYEECIVNLKEYLLKFSLDNNFRL